MNEDQKNKLIMQMDADRRNLMTDDFLKRADAEAKLNEIRKLIEFSAVNGLLINDKAKDKILDIIDKNRKVHIVRDYRKPQS